MANLRKVETPKYIPSIPQGQGHSNPCPTCMSYLQEVGYNINIGESLRLRTPVNNRLYRCVNCLNLYEEVPNG
jgi:hypothetical protein